MSEYESYEAYKQHLSETTRAGLGRARAAGIKLGRPQVATRSKVLKAYKRCRHDVRATCQLLGISRASLYRYLSMPMS